MVLSPELSFVATMYIGFGIMVVLLFIIGAIWISLIVIIPTKYIKKTIFFQDKEDFKNDKNDL